MKYVTVLSDKRIFPSFMRSFIAGLLVLLLCGLLPAVSAYADVSDSVSPVSETDEWIISRYYTAPDAANGSEIGRMVIPSAGIDVAVYSAVMGNPQDITDACDSAAAIYGDPRYQSNVLIADHVDQEFRTLRTADVGDMMYIISPDMQVYRYQCTEAFAGHDGEYDLISYDDTPIDEYGDVVLYTCNGWPNIDCRAFSRCA